MLSIAMGEYKIFRSQSIETCGIATMSSLVFLALNQLPVSLGDAVAGRAATDHSIIPAGYQFAFGLTVSGNYSPYWAVDLRSDGS